MCLVAPDGADCESLRRSGWLPPTPPQLERLQRCWRVAEPRDDLPRSWICIAPREIAILTASGWDVWPHDGWTRSDHVQHAGWRAQLGDGRTLWLTIVRAPLAPKRSDGQRYQTLPVPQGSASMADAFAVHVSDGSGLSAAVVADDTAAEVESRREALPTVADVCAAARACVDAVRRREPTDLESVPEPNALDAAVTLRGCLAVWRRASARVLDSGVPVPRSCGVSPAQVEWWSYELEPPFAPID